MIAPKEYAEMMEDEWQREADDADAEAESGLTRSDREEIAAELRGDTLREDEP